jgi:hypothetical protein
MLAIGVVVVAIIHRWVRQRVATARRIAADRGEADN